MENKKKPRLSLSVILPVAIILAAVFLLSGTLAWLTSLKQFEGNAGVGKVGVEIKHNGNVVSGSINKDTGEYEIGSAIAINVSSAESPINETISFVNTGTIAGLARVLVSAYVVNTVDDGTQNIIISKNDANLNIAGFVPQYSSEIVQSNFYNHYYLYNKTVDAKEEVNIVNEIIVNNQELVGKTIYFDITIEIVVYSGNAYAVGSEEKPFGEVPEEWIAWK